MIAEEDDIPILYPPSHIEELNEIEREELKKLESRKNFYTRLLETQNLFVFFLAFMDEKNLFKNDNFSMDSFMTCLTFLISCLVFISLLLSLFIHFTKKFPDKDKLLLIWAAYFSAAEAIILLYELGYHFFTTEWVRTPNDEEKFCFIVAVKFCYSMLLLFAANKWQQYSKVLLNTADGDVIIEKDEEEEIVKID